MSEARDTIGDYLPEHDPVLALWHHLAVIVDEADPPRRLIGGLTLPAATIYLVGVFEGEVVQGGFLQFLSNPSGDFAAETLQSLREIGAHISVELLEKALAAFPGGDVPKARDERLAGLDPDALQPLDVLYNQHVDALSPHRVENLGTLLLDYMKEHAGVRLAYLPG